MCLFMCLHFDISSVLEFNKFLNLVFKIKCFSVIQRSQFSPPEYMLLLFLNFFYSYKIYAGVFCYTGLFINHILTKHFPSSGQFFLQSQVFSLWICGELKIPKLWPFIMVLILSMHEQDILTFFNVEWLMIFIFVNCDELENYSSKCLRIHVCWYTFAVRRKV